MSRWLEEDSDDWEDSTLLKLGAVVTLTFRSASHFTFKNSKNHVRLLELNQLLFMKLVYKMHELNIIKEEVCDFFLLFTCVF